MRERLFLFMNRKQIGKYMSSQIIKLVILSTVIFLTACDITFKRKGTDVDAIPVNMEKQNKGKISIKSKTVNKGVFNKKDSHIINSFYADNSNEKIRKDMIMQTKLSKEQNSKLVIGNIIPRDVQVIPLPLKLERILSALPLQYLRVQIGENVILMNVKSRKISDLIKL